MLLLLPPSETKRSGGRPGSRLDLSRLGYRRLDSARRECLDALAELVADHDAAVAGLRLGVRQHGFVEVDRAVRRSPVLPAIERYTGVLYDAIGIDALSAQERERLKTRIALHSSLFGLLGPEDEIPEYRLSHDSRLPGRSLTRLWSGPIAEALAEVDTFVVDARSQGYRGLGPLTDGRGVRLTVVTRDGDGRVRALNHFNKRAKGELVSALARSATVPRSVDELVDWGAASGIVFEPGDEPGGWLLVV